MVEIVCQEVPFHTGNKNIQIQNKVVKYVHDHSALDGQEHVHDGQEHVHNVQPSGSVTGRKRAHKRRHSSDHQYIN